MAVHVVLVRGAAFRGRVAHQNNRSAKAIGKHDDAMRDTSA
jgi:hypothetical protein